MLAEFRVLCEYDIFSVTNLFTNGNSSMLQSLVFAALCFVFFIHRPARLLVLVSKCAPHRLYTVRHNYRTPYSFKRHNLVNIRFILNISGNIAEGMLSLQI